MASRKKISYDELVECAVEVSEELLALESGSERMWGFETKRCVDGLYLTPRAHGCTSFSRERRVPSPEIVGGVEGGSLPCDLEEEIQFERHFHAVRSTALDV